MCLLPETTLDGALAIARLLGEQVQALEIEHARSEVAAHVSVSLGVCGKPAGFSGSAAELVRQADEQLYNAKTGGRNRSCGAAIRVG